MPISATLSTAAIDITTCEPADTENSRVDCVERSNVPHAFSSAVSMKNSSWSLRAFMNSLASVKGDGNGFQG